MFHDYNEKCIRRQKTHLFFSVTNFQWLKIMDGLFFSFFSKHRLSLIKKYSLYVSSRYVIRHFIFFHTIYLKWYHIFIMYGVKKLYLLAQVKHLLAIEWTFLALPLYCVFILLANHTTKNSGKATTQEEPQAW